MKRLITLAGAAALLAVTAGSAAADGGALNMLNDRTMMTVPMVNNTLHANTSSTYGSYGNAGMFCAVFITSGSVLPGGCSGHE